MKEEAEKLIITDDMITAYENHLMEWEKSKATIRCYVRNICAFREWIGERSVEKSAVLEYKEMLMKQHKTTTANVMLSSLNSFFEFCGAHNLRVRAIKVQKEIVYDEKKELSKQEYEKLLKAAATKRSKRLYYIMQTICASGIRISELPYITVEAVKKKSAEVNCKGKIRTVILPDDLCVLLMRYISTQDLKSGCVFLTRGGLPVNRSNIWAEMRALCKKAGIPKEKVFPHNLRHLFARTYYSTQKDIVRLADILGHTSVDTTRVYTKESGKTHRKQVQKLGLVVLDK